MDGEIYLWRDRHDPDAVIVATGHEDGGDDRDPDVCHWGVVHADAFFAIFGAGGHDILAKLDSARGPVAFTLVIPEM